MRRVVYLSGRIANCTYEEATEARVRARDELARRGWDSLDPMRGKEILSSLATIDEEKASELLGVTPTAIIQRDFDDVRRADALIVLSGDQPSWGTAYEWAIAHFLMHKPVVVVAPTSTTGGRETRAHPWCKQMSSYFAETVDEAIEFLDRWFDRGYTLDDRPITHDLSLPVKGSGSVVVNIPASTIPQVSSTIPQVSWPVVD